MEHERVRRALVVVNPRARRVRDPAALAERLAGLLAQGGTRAEVEIAADAAAATDLARQADRRGHDAVVAVGGDGTANTVIEGIAGTGMRFGLIPQGTSNSLAHYMGLRPDDLTAACAVISAGRVRCIDLGRINGRHFIHMAGIGLDALMAREVSHEWKSRAGVLAFAAKFPRTLLRARPWQLDTEVDGRRITGAMWGVFISNTPWHIWRIPLNLAGSERDGQLDLILLHACSRARLMRIAFDVFVLKRSLRREPEIEIIQARDIRLEAQPVASWEVDGEISGITPVRCTVEPHALNLLVPAAPHLARTDSCPVAGLSSG
jgi:diacylglycerol kinase (ATP)